MSDSILNKEFIKKDVNRIRNLYQKKFGDKTADQVSFSLDKEEEHKEGDIWVSNGKTWTIKNGLKRTYSKLSSLKEDCIIPLFCPKCDGKLDKRCDIIVYKLFKTCFNCNVEKETQLKIEGKYEEYAKKMIDDNIKAYEEDVKVYLEELINRKDEFVTETGGIEDWSKSKKAI